MGPSRHWKAAAVALVAAILSGCAAMAPAGRASGPTKDTLAAVAGALGPPEALIAATAMTAEQNGLSYPNEQARNPSQAVGEAGRFYRWHFDLRQERLVRDAEQRFPGGIRFWSRTALTPAGGWNVDLLRWRTGDDLLPVAAADALETRSQWERLFPHLAVAQAKASGATTTSAEGFSYTDGSGAAVEVIIDPRSFLPTRLIQSVGGASRGEYRYFDYERRHGVMMPTRVQTWAGGRLQEEITLGDTSLRAVADADIGLPVGYVTPASPGEAVARELAPGVFFFDNMPTGYHSLAIDMGDHLVVVESPQNVAYARTQRDLLARARPGLPVRHVLVTHHHGDHTGGLGFWAEEGATIIVPAGARVAIERQLAARGFTGELRIEEVEGRRIFGPRLEVHTLANDHNEANLLAYVPSARLLFQGDMFYAPERGAIPPEFPIVAQLRRAISAFDLDVASIAGVHGRIASIEELEASALKADPGRDGLSLTRAGSGDQAERIGRTGRADGLGA